MSLPGTWSDPYPFSATVAEKEAVYNLDKESEKPICDVAITAGDRTVDMCKPGKPNCPIKRPLEPRRNIMPGMWTYQKSPNNKTKRDINPLVIIFVLIFFLVLLTQL